MKIVTEKIRDVKLLALDSIQAADGVAPHTTRKTVIDVVMRKAESVIYDLILEELTGELNNILWGDQ